MKLFEAMGRFKKIKNEYYTPKMYIHFVRSDSLLTRVIKYSYILFIFSFIFVIFDNLYLKSKLIESWIILATIFMASFIYGAVLKLILQLLFYHLPYYRRFVYSLDYIKEYIILKNETLNLEDKKIVSKYFHHAIKFIPDIFRESKTDTFELNEELLKRFSLMEKELVSISTTIYFSASTDLKNHIVNISRISRIINNHDFGLLDPDPDYELKVRGKFWHRLLDWSEFQKQTAKWLAVLPAIFISIILLAILQMLNPVLFNKIIGIVSPLR